MTTTNDRERNEKSTDELTKLNELFAKRYTNQDEEFKNMAQRSNSPPIVDDWTLERNTGQLQRQFDNNNQRRHYPNNRQQYRNYSNDRQQHQDYSNDHRQYRDDSNNRQHNRSYSNRDRQYRDRSRSPTSRQTRR